MRKQFLILTSVVLIFIGFGCGPKIYKSEQFDDAKSKHKIVAILPGDVQISLRPNEMKKTSQEKIQEIEEETGYNIQDKMYSWFLRRSDKRKYTVQFQDITKTNALLKQNNINFSDMKSHTMEEYAKMLGVDAIISTRTTMKKPMSEGAALAVGVLFGAWGSTNDVHTTINIHEGQKGDLIWKYDYDATGSVGSNTDRLVNALMRNASKKFPYNDR